MVWVSVRTGFNFGLHLENAFNLLIASCSFGKNQPLETCSDCFGGNVYIKYDDQSINERLYNADIVQSNFTFGLNPSRLIKK